MEPAPGGEGSKLWHHHQSQHAVSTQGWCASRSGRAALASLSARLPHDGVDHLLQECLERAVDQEDHRHLLPFRLDAEGISRAWVLGMASERDDLGATTAMAMPVPEQLLTV